MPPLSANSTIERINSVVTSLILLGGTPDDEPGFPLLCRLLGDELADAAAHLPGNDPMAD
jgi:hypothetical protein